MWWLLLALWIPMQSTSAPCPNPAAASSVQADVIAAQATSQYTTITMNKGGTDGLVNSWGGWLLDPGGRKLVGSEFCLDTIRPRTSKASLKLPYKAVRKSGLKVVLVGP